MTLHTYNSNQYPYEASSSYNLQFPRYSPDKILNFKITTARSQVKLRSHYDVAYLTNVLAKCQPSTPDSFRDIAQTRFSQGHNGKVKG